MEVRGYGWLGIKQWSGDKAKAIIEVSEISHFQLHSLKDSSRCSLDFFLWAKRSFTPR